MGVKFPKAYNSKTGKIMNALEVHELKRRNLKKFLEIKDYFFCENGYEGICMAPMSFVNRKGTVFFRTKPRKEHSLQCGASKDIIKSIHQKDKKRTVVKIEKPSPRYLGSTYNTISFSVNKIKLEDSFRKLVEKLSGTKIENPKPGTIYTKDAKSKGTKKERQFADIDITAKASGKTGNLGRISLRQIHASNIRDLHIDEVRFVYGKVKRVEIIKGNKDNRVAVVLDENVRWVPKEEELKALRRKNHILYRLIMEEPKNLARKLLIVPAVILPSIPSVKERLGNKYYLKLLTEIAEFSFVENQPSHSQTRTNV